MILAPDPFSEAASRLVALLERYRETYPTLDEELARQRSLTDTMAEHHRRGEQTRSAWQAALSNRWEREVAAQRAYSAVQRQLVTYYGPDPAYAQLIAPARPASACTASDLLYDLRRLGASLELLAPQPPFATAAITRLRTAADELALAIDATARCEAERRAVLSEQRIAANLYERAYDRAQRHLADLLGEETLGT